jgi:hypothetical protein
LLDVDGVGAYVSSTTLVPDGRVVAFHSGPAVGPTAVVGLVLNFGRGDDDGANVLSFLSTLDGFVVTDGGCGERVGRTLLVDSGDIDGVCGLTGKPNSEGLGVGDRSGERAGLTECSSLLEGRSVVVAAGDDDGASRSAWYSDGSRVAVGSGAEVG